MQQWIYYEEQKPTYGQWIVVGYINAPTVIQWGPEWGVPLIWYPLPEPPIPLYINFTEGENT